MSSVIQELEDAAELKSAGVIDSPEFTKLKARIIGGQSSVSTATEVAASSDNTTFAGLAASFGNLIDTITRSVGSPQIPSTSATTTKRSWVDVCSGKPMEVPSEFVTVTAKAQQTS